MLKKKYPPAGSFLSPCRVISALFISSPIASVYPAQKVFCYNSAKTALYVFFRALYLKDSKKPVAVSAFTCPDIVSAILKVGLKVKLLDVGQDDVRLHVTYEKVKDCSAVVLSNLYGLIDEIDDIKDVFVVEDVCQAALSFTQRENARRSLVQVYSFGRGKAYSGAGGGMLVLHDERKDLIADLELINRDIEPMNIVDVFIHFVKINLLWVLQNPRLYRCVSSLAFLKLGETNVDEDFTCKSAPRILQKVFTAYKKYAENNILNVGFHLERYTKILKEASPEKFKILHKFDNEVLIRYPIYFTEQKVREEYYNKHKDLGVSKSYNKTLKDLFPLTCFVNSQDEMKNACECAKKILTLSLVSSISQGDIEALLNE